MRKQLVCLLGAMSALSLCACGSRTVKNHGQSGAAAVCDDCQVSNGGTSGVGGVTGLLVPDITCPGPVQCVSPTTAAYCTPQNEATEVICAEAMASDGLESHGCVSDAGGDGCTIDGFLDADCENGTPPFAVCAELGAVSLVDVYRACYHDLDGAQAVVSCYGGFVSDDQTLVDCLAAQAVCYP